MIDIKETEKDGCLTTTSISFRQNKENLEHCDHVLMSNSLSLSWLLLMRIGSQEVSLVLQVKSLQFIDNLIGETILLKCCSASVLEPHPSSVIYLTFYFACICVCNVSMPLCVCLFTWL